MVKGVRAQPSTWRGPRTGCFKKKKLSRILKAMQLEWESVARLLRDLSIFGRQEFRRLKDVFK